MNILKQSYEKLMQSLGAVGRHEDFCVLEVVVLDVVLLVLIALLDVAVTVTVILVIVYLLASMSTPHDALSRKTKAR